MKILTEAIVSNSEMIKNYKACREKAERFGKIFVLKNNQLDAVFFSVSEYEKISAVIEYMEGLNDKELDAIVESLPKDGRRENYSDFPSKNDMLESQQ